MRRELFRQFRKVRSAVIVAHRNPRRFPNVFLRVQLWTARRKAHQFQTRVRRKYRTDRLAFVPGSAIPEHQNRNLRVGQQNPVEKQRRDFGGHQIGTQKRFFARLQIQRAVEVRTLAARGDFDHRRLSDGRPDAHCGRLQIQRGFILR